MEDRVEERVTALEVKVTFQEDLIQQLNEVVIGQQRTLDALLKRVEQLHRMLLEVEESKAPPPSEKPPHY